MANEFYYLHVPARPRAVHQRVDFLPITEFLADEQQCKALWEMIGRSYKTRSKFLAIWPAVRFVAVHRRGNMLGGFLLVSTPVNWQIDYVTVDESLRHQGIAVALVHEALNQALARKVPYVMLTSKPSLRPLYEGQCGFTVIGSNEELSVTREGLWTGEDVRPLASLPIPVI